MDSRATTSVVVSLSKSLHACIVVDNKKRAPQLASMTECTLKRASLNSNHQCLRRRSMSGSCQISVFCWTLPKCRIQVAAAARSAAAGCGCLDVHEYTRLLTLVQVWIAWSSDVRMDPTASHLPTVVFVGLNTDHYFTIAVMTESFGAEITT